MYTKLKTILIGTVMILSCDFAYSQNAKFGGLFDHVFEVTKYDDWGKGYLTIIDNHTVCCSGIWTPFTWECDKFIANGTIITGINGRSTKNMSPNEFYRITDMADSLLIKCIRFGLKEEEELEVIVLKKIPKEYANYDFSDGYLAYNYAYRSPIYQRNTNAKKQNLYIRELYDSYCDFSTKKTYDFFINSSDPLFDKSLLESMMKNMELLSWSRDTVNPDVIFTIAKSADESISATYVPPTSRTVNTGSYTTSRYNYLTHKYDYVTTNNTRTIHEGGYTETTKVANIFLEIAMLDAKQINNPKVTHAPIIWQITFKRDVVNPNFNSNDAFSVYASAAEVPPADRFVYLNETLTEMSGFSFEYDGKHNVVIVTYVEKDSIVEKAGFQVGDKIIKINGEKIKMGHLSCLAVPSKTTYVLIKRNGEKKHLILCPNQKNIMRTYWITAEELQEAREQ
ncbi:MAG: PDZ domain-containing protein [Bacteroidales bacterium]|nr:PDZ domain-containing protein [Bacteroidales bacterium]